MPTAAVLGASTDRRKYGNKAVRALLQSGWQVIPVNPAGGVIEGLPVASSLDEVPRPVDLITVYLPPAIGLQVLPEIAAHAPAQVIFNPGADAPELVSAALDLGLNPVQACTIRRL